MLPGNTGIAEGQAVILFKILRKLNRKTGTDGCVQMILLPSGNDLPCAKISSKSIIVPLTYGVLGDVCTG